jgi:cytochrome c oxidase subunit 3
MSTEQAASGLQEQFVDIAQQREASTLGMWVFLGTEVMFFGGVFLAFAIARSFHVEAFNAAAQHLDIVAGSVNTAILLTSSYVTAVAVPALKAGQKTRVIRLLSSAVVLGALFLVIKGYEYHEEWTKGFFPGEAFKGSNDRPTEFFFLFYFILTGVHGVHLLVALGVAAIVIWLVATDRVTQNKYMTLEVSALYWHFVDIVWIFVFPLLYLIGGRG